MGLGLSLDDPALMVAGIEGGAVVRSTDGGRSWQDHRRGAMRDCHQLAEHATLHGHFYEGGYGGGDLFTDAVSHCPTPQGIEKHTLLADPATQLLSARRYYEVKPLYHAIS